MIGIFFVSSIKNTDVLFRVSIKNIADEHKSDSMLGHIFEIAESLEQMALDNSFHSLHIDSFRLNVLENLDQMIFDERNFVHGYPAEHEIDDGDGIFAQGVSDVARVRIIDLDEFFLQRTDGIVR